MKAPNERDFPAFDHEKRAGGDDSWIYAFDARKIGDKLPTKKYGPWDFRERSAAAETGKQLSQTLWKPSVSLKGDRKVTRAGVAAHGTFDNCWIIIRNRVYEFSMWKDRPPGGPFVARMYVGKDATAEFGDYHSRRTGRLKEICAKRSSACSDYGMFRDRIVNERHIALETM